MMLLALVFTTSISAQPNVSHTGNGKAYADEDNPTHIHAIPAKNNYVQRVIWSEQDPNNLGEGETASSMILKWSGADYYDALCDYGFVQVTFAEYGDKVLVTFNRNGHGTAPLSQNLKLGDKVTRPEDPQEENYKFVGWYKDAECTQPYDFDAVLSKDDLKFSTESGHYPLRLYAKWVDAGDVKVTFNMNGFGTAPSSQNLKLGDKVARPSAPTSYDGHQFIWWYKDSECTQPYYFEDELKKENLVWSEDDNRYELTLYAKWVNNVSFVGNCGQEVTWKLTELAEWSGLYKLTIDGSGEMNDYEAGNSPWYVFRHAIRSISISDDVTKIGNNAFEGIERLDELTIPVSTSANHISFADLKQLTTLNISGSGEMNDYTTGNTPWKNCRESIEHLTIGEGITRIGNCAFYKLQSLKGIVIPTSVTSIGKNAFYLCTSLNAITIPVGAVGDASVFYGCTEVKKLTISGSGDLPNYKKSKTPWGNCNKTIETLTIGDEVTSIGSGAFCNFVNLKDDVTIPTSVKRIQWSAFSSVSTQKDNPGIVIKTVQGSQLDFIGDNAFSSANAVIDLSNSLDLTEVKSKTFHKVSKDAILPYSVKKIDKGAYKAINKTSFLYIYVLEDNYISVNGKLYVDNGNVKEDRRVNLSPFDIYKKYLTLAMVETEDAPKDINITTTYTDNTDPLNPVEKPIVEAYKYTLPTDDTPQDIEIIKEARGGETVILSWDGEHIPAGKYVSGFTIKDADGQIAATAHKDKYTEDYSFIMPKKDVYIEVNMADQYEYNLDLTAADAQVEVPQMLRALLMGQSGYSIHDPATQKHYLDLNLDGTPDLELLEPEPEEDVTPDTKPEPAATEEPSDDPDEGSIFIDPFADKYSVKRLAGADNVTVNSRFSLPYPPFPLPFNGVLIKLKADNQEEQMATIESLYDHNNVEGLNGKTCHVQLTKRTLYKDGYWNTLCLPFDVTDGDNTDNVTFSGTPLAGAEARTLSSATINGTTLNLTFGNPVTTLSAGVPYIIKWTAAQQNIVNPIFMNVTIDKTHHDYDNGAEGDLRVRFMGTYDEMKFYLEDKSILFVGENNQLFYPQPTQQNIDDGVYPNIKPFRAYFKIGNDNAAVREFSEINLNFEEDEVTGVNEVNGVNASLGVNDDSWYTLDGRKLEKQPTKAGLYFYGNRKVLVGDKR